ncbi:MAG TPA: ethanolamine utilization acetate kinase EutQ [Pseudomonadales bacterium]|nr:ethanolamine utilization acetate kinase EutQ [Pseudomonadales bacterium]
MKKVITANDIRDAIAAGKRSLEVELPHCIVTPEARSVANQSGFSLQERLAEKPAVAKAPADDELAKIRAAVLARLPAGSADPQLVEQLVRKALQGQALQNQAPQSQSSATTSQAGFESRTGSGGIKLVKGGSVRFGRFDGVADNWIGITDVVGAEDGSSMGAGFMQWENAFFPWTLNYDEIDLVLEGELHIRQGGETLVGKAGDLLFIPKGSSIEFGTPSKVRFFYVTWPVNWQDQ